MERRASVDAGLGRRQADAEAEDTSGAPLVPGAPRRTNRCLRRRRLRRECVPRFSPGNSESEISPHQGRSSSYFRCRRRTLEAHCVERNRYGQRETQGDEPRFARPRAVRWKPARDESATSFGTAPSPTPWNRTPPATNFPTVSPSMRPTSFQKERDSAGVTENDQLRAEVFDANHVRGLPQRAPHPPIDAPEVREFISSSNPILRKFYN